MHSQFENPPPVTSGAIASLCNLGKSILSTIGIIEGGRVTFNSAPFRSFSDCMRTPGRERAWLNFDSNGIISLNARESHVRMFLTHEDGANGDNLVVDVRVFTSGGTRAAFEKFPFGKVTEIRIDARGLPGSDGPDDVGGIEGSGTAGSKGGTVQIATNIDEVELFALIKTPPNVAGGIGGVGGKYDDTEVTATFKTATVSRGSDTVARQVTRYYTEKVPTGHYGETNSVTREVTETVYDTIPTEHRTTETETYTTTKQCPTRNGKNGLPGQSEYVVLAADGTESIFYGFYRPKVQTEIKFRARSHYGVLEPGVEVEFGDVGLINAKNMPSPTANLYLMPYKNDSFKVLETGILQDGLDKKEVKFLSSPIVIRLSQSEHRPASNSVYKTSTALKLAYTYGRPDTWHTLTPKEIHLPIRYPITMSACESSLACLPGESINLSFNIKNDSLASLGSKVEPPVGPRAVEVLFETGPKSSKLLRINHVKVRGEYISLSGGMYPFDLIPASDCLNVAASIDIPADAKPFSHFDFSQKLCLAPYGKVKTVPIEERNYRIRTLPNRIPFDHADYIYLTSTSTTEADYHKWTKIAQDRGCRMSYWDSELDGFLDLNARVNESQNLGERLKGKTLVLPYCGAVLKGRAVDIQKLIDFPSLAEAVFKRSLNVILDRPEEANFLKILYSTYPETASQHGIVTFSQFKELLRNKQLKLEIGETITVACSANSFFGQFDALIPFQRIVKRITKAIEASCANLSLQIKSAFEPTSEKRFMHTHWKLGTVTIRRNLDNNFSLSRED